MYRCVAHINQNALLNNLAYLKTKSRCHELVFMVKANAYGHGLYEVAQILAQQDIIFGIAALEEAMILRDAGVQHNIFLFDGSAFVGEESELIDLNVTPMLTSFEAALALAHELERRRFKQTYPVHLKIDTGFIRNGLIYSEILDGQHDNLLALLNNNPLINLEGIATHFACADLAEDQVSQIQLARFHQCLSYLEAKNIRFKKIHLANSSAILRNIGNSSQDNKLGNYQLLARPGLAAYGISQDPNLIPVMQLQAQVVAIKHIQAHQGIGYGYSFVADKPMPIAIVAMGYGDGLRRSLSNRGHMLISGIKAPIVGNISMDSCALDLTQVYNQLGPDHVKPGTMVTVIGRDNHEEISADTLAQLDQTIPYEILTSIAERITRRII